MTAQVLQMKIKIRKAKPGKTKSKPKVSAASARQMLLRTLRAESRTRQWSAYSKDENTPLVELARAAAYSTKRSICWRGIRFPLRHSLFLVVLDPETREPLISTNGGVF